MAKVAELEALYLRLDCLRYPQQANARRAAKANTPEGHMDRLREQIEKLEREIVDAGESPPTDVQWSGRGAIPSLGAQINVTMNGLGRATVIAYQPTEGYLGLRVRFLAPPEFWIKQNTGQFGTGLIFGIDIE